MKKLNLTLPLFFIIIIGYAFSSFFLVVTSAQSTSNNCTTINDLVGFPTDKNLTLLYESIANQLNVRIDELDSICINDEIVTSFVNLNNVEGPLADNFAKDFRFCGSGTYPSTGTVYADPGVQASEAGITDDSILCCSRPNSNLLIDPFIGYKSPSELAGANASSLPSDYTYPTYNCCNDSSCETYSEEADYGIPAGNIVSYSEDNFGIRPFVVEDPQGVETNINTDTGSSLDTIPGFGTSCVENYGECETGKINLYESITRGRIDLFGNGYSDASILSKIREEWPNNYLNLCVNESLTTIIKGTSSQNKPVFCPVGTVVSASERDDDLLGCCSVGYTFTVGNRTNSELSEAGDPYLNNKRARCCENTGNQTPYSVLGDSCYDQSGSQINYSNPDQSVISDGVLGSVELDNGSSEISITNDQKQLACPDYMDNGCMLLANGTITDPSEFKNLTVGQTPSQCSVCFENGEPIAVDGEELIVCSGDGQTTRQGLINGNITDTLAYLNSDDANRELLKTCRERGGIYLAIGCIEPTPVGIITALIRIGFGVMGGVALIMLILAGLAYQSGDEAQIEEAKKRVMSVFTGLAVLIFSVLILRIIGINVLDVLPEGSV